MLEVVFQRRLTLWRALACAAQAGILFFLLHARSTVLWEIMAIELFAVFALVVWRSYRQAILSWCCSPASSSHQISTSRYPIIRNISRGNTATRVAAGECLNGGWPSTARLPENTESVRSMIGRSRKLCGNPFRARALSDLPIRYLFERKRRVCLGALRTMGASAVLRHRS